MAKIGEGSSPRSVLGSWKMDARGELTTAGKKNCAKNKGFNEQNKGFNEKNKGFVENRCLSEKFGLVEKKGLTENNGFSEKLGLFVTNGYSENTGFSGNEGCPEDKVFLENKRFFENEGFSENKGILEKRGFPGNKRFSEVNGFRTNKVFPVNKGFSENEVFSGNVGFFDNEGLPENKNVYGNKGFSRNKEFSGNDGFSGKEGFSGNDGFTGSKAFYESGFEFWATQNVHEDRRNDCKRSMGILREKCVKDDRIRVSGKESFSESGLESGATEDEHEVKRNGCRRNMGVPREKCVNEERVRFFRVFAPSLGECEGGFRRKRRKKKEENGSDPLVVLGSDILLMILYRLDARSLAQSILVSHGWQALAACDYLWSKKCEQLWFGKAHIPRAAMQRGLSKLATYSISVLDAKRTGIMKEDLCDHVWEFRFKTPAPLYWLNLDPSWRGTGPPMRRYFHPDGSQTADPTDRVWGGHECTYSIVFSDEGKIREHYVRINRWPRMSVSRKHDWGWELDNHVYCYSSIPDADKEGGTGPLYPIW